MMPLQDNSLNRSDWKRMARSAFCFGQWPMDIFKIGMTRMNFWIILSTHRSGFLDGLSTQLLKRLMGYFLNNAKGVSWGVEIITGVRMFISIFVPRARLS